MKIARVEAIPYAIDYRKPLQFASGEVRAAEHVLVRVHTDDGVIGTADAPPRPFAYGETQTSVRSIIADHFAPAIIGTGILEREFVHARLDRTVGNPVAKAALDMAIWDAIGQTLGVSVSELLGGFPTGCGSPTWSASRPRRRWSPRRSACAKPTASPPSR